MRRRLSFRVLSVLALTVSLGLVAEPAHALVAPAGSCSGALLHGVFAPGLTDTTQVEKIAMHATDNLAVRPATKNLGTCSGLVPTSRGAIAGSPTPTEAVRHESFTFTGSASCSQTATAPGVDPGDPNAASALPLSGKLQINTATTGLQAYVHVTGVDLDVASIAGSVFKGASVGAAVGGSLWEDPAVGVRPSDPGYPGIGNSHIAVDPNALVMLVGCADGVPNTIPSPGITLILVGDGNSPLLGAPATGLTFSFGI